MPCEEYREALSEAAAGGERELPREVQTHVESCHACRAAFQEEQQLLAAIDCGVQRIANVDVPVSLLPRVREVLDREVSRRKSIFAYFAFAGAAVCAALVFVSVHAWRRTNIEPRSIASTSPATPMEKPSEETIAHDVSSQVGPGLRHSSNHRVTPTATQPRFAVLLQVGQKQAVDKLLGELRSGAIKPNDVIVEKAEAPPLDLQVSPLSISPIEVKPLAAIVEDAAPSGDKTKS